MNGRPAPPTTMNPSMAYFPRVVAVAALLLVTTGCRLLPEPKPDPTKFFVLGLPAGAPGETGRSAGGAALVLRPIEVAGYLRNPPLVVRRGDHEIEFRDYARWGETLEQGVARILGAGLRARGVAVEPAASRLPVGTERQLTVRVLACEGTAAGGVFFRAGWDLTKPGEAPGVGVGGEFRAEGLTWDGKNEAQLVARLSEAVAALAGEIATAVGAAR